MAQSEAQYAVISEASSGNNTVVAAVAGKQIRVLSYVLVAAGAVNARWESDADGTALSGVMVMGAAGDEIEAAFNPLGHFETVAGELLNLELSGAVSVDGHCTYVLV